MPEGLVAWGMDEELWMSLSNKKGVVDLLRKGEEAKGRARIARLREIIDAEKQEALELRVFVLKREGELTAKRRARMLEAYEATAAGAAVRARRAQPSVEASVEQRVGVRQALGRALGRKQASPAVEPAPSAERSASMPPPPPPPAVEGERRDEAVEDKLTSLREREARAAAKVSSLKLEALRAQGELSIRRREANRAAADAYARLRSAREANATLPSVEAALLQAALADAAETTAEAAQRAYKASPASAFLPWPAQAPSPESVPPPPPPSPSAPADGPAPTVRGRNERRATRKATKRMPTSRQGSSAAIERRLATRIQLDATRIQLEAPTDCCCGCYYPLLGRCRPSTPLPTALD